MAGQRRDGWYLVCFVASLLIIGTEADIQNETREIHVIFASSFEGPFDTRVIFQGMVNLVLDFVHSRDDMLPGYRIVPHFLDSMVTVILIV